uniref:Uncharacterized protein n=1 Tax=Knipowitschia caucasica TaxID=637954 RepID=A0AAV2J192_KNICA
MELAGHVSGYNDPRDGPLRWGRAVPPGGRVQTAGGSEGERAERPPPPAAENKEDEEERGSDCDVGKVVVTTEEETDTEQV